MKAKVKKVEISEVSFREDDYIAKVQINGTSPFTVRNSTSQEDVTAIFNIRLPKKGKYDAERRYRRSYEDIDREARKLIASFCREILEVVESPSPR